MFECASTVPHPRQAGAARLTRVLAGAPSVLAEAQVRRLRLYDASAELTRIAASPPSPQTLASLHAIDVSLLSAHDRVNWLGLWEAHRGWFDAHGQGGIVAVGGAAAPSPHPQRPDSERDDIGREHVALALRLSSPTGGGRLDTARELTGRLGRTLTALARGQITYWHAKAIADAAAPLGDAAALAVERITLDGTPAFETLTAFRKRVARAVMAADPQTADEQHLSAVEGRRVLMWPEPHGMATITATLTAAEAATTMTALTALALGSRADGDDRGIDVLRADAFTGLFASQLAQRGLPSQQRARPRVSMTIDFATLLGLADHPGHLDGYGPIPPVMARRLAAGGDWHRLVTDPVSGALLDLGTRTYRPPAELVEFLTTRDRTCRFPTCARPARRCDLDHAVAFDMSGQGTGGSTSAAGMGCLCRRNHRQKTAGDIRLLSHPDGSANWTTTSGHTYHQPAIDHCPEHTAHLKQLRADVAADQRRADDIDPEHADGAWDSSDIGNDCAGPDDCEAPELPNAAHDSSAIAHEALPAKPRATVRTPTPAAATTTGVSGRRRPRCDRRRRRRRGAE